METIELIPLWHRDIYCIAIRNRLNDRANLIVRNFPNRQYSRTNGCWYVKYSPSALDLLFQTLSEVCFVKVPILFDEKTKIARVPLTPKALPEGYSECLIRMRYSDSTRITYQNQMRQFMAFIEPIPIGKITKELVDHYMIYLVDKRKVSVSTQNTAINAIKFYLEQVNKGDRI